MEKTCDPQMATGPRFFEIAVQLVDLDKLSYPLHKIHEPDRPQASSATTVESSL